MIVGDDELDAVETAPTQAEQEVFPGRAALRLAISTARIWRRPSQSIPMAVSTAWLMTTPPSRTFS